MPPGWLIHLEWAPLLVLGLALAARTARAQGGRWQALLFGAGGALAAWALFEALDGWLAPGGSMGRLASAVALPALYLSPHAASNVDRAHPGGRLMLGLGGAGVMALGIVGGILVSLATDGPTERVLLLASMVPLAPFLSWWVGWGLESAVHRHGPGTVMLLSLLLFLGVAAAVPWSDARLWLLWTGHAVGFVAWLLMGRNPDP